MTAALPPVLTSGQRISPRAPPDHLAAARVDLGSTNPASPGMERRAV